MNENNTEPDNENELLDKVMEAAAINEYCKFWHELTDTQCAYLVKKVAIKYAELVNKQKQ